MLYKTLKDKKKAKLMAFGKEMTWTRMEKVGKT